MNNKTQIRLAILVLRLLIILVKRRFTYSREENAVVCAAENAIHDLVAHEET